MEVKELEFGFDNYGWIKLHRKLQRNDFWVNAGPFDPRSALIDLFLSASYQESKLYENGSKAVIDIKPGQILTSLKSLERKWGWNYSKVSRFLNNLEEMGTISQERKTKYTIITITNWAAYQDVRPKKKAAPADDAPEQKPQTVPEVNLNKEWDDMTPAEQAAYLRK